MAQNPCSTGNHVPTSSASSQPTLRLCITISRKAGDRNMSFSYQYINFIRKIWTTKLTVLVIGSIRMLGSKIVAAVFNKGTIEVKAMVRSSNDSHKEKRQKIDEMKAKGTGIVEGDLIKPETLLRVCAEVDVIVSAVGNNEVTVLG
jgi:hypothetical protein